MSVVELVAVSKRYGDRRALDDVSFSLGAGEALGLLGPNGAGKTTALRLLLGFSHPTSGTVRLKGRLPTDPESRVGVGYLPERLKLPSRMTVRACLNHHSALTGLIGVERASRVDEVLERTRLAERSHDRIGSLSKGLTQRVGFAQALLGRPELMLLDEPTSGLDPIGVREARDWIRIAREWGCAVLVSSHLLSEVERTCDRIAILDRGRVVAEGALDAIVAEGETLEDAFVRLVAVE